MEFEIHRGSCYSMVYAIKMKSELFGHNSWFGFTVSKPMNIKVRIRLAEIGRIKQ